MSTRGFWFLLAGLALVIANAMSARAAVGFHFPSLFVDPWGDYSNVALPSWPAPPSWLQGADRLWAVDGVTLERGPGAPFPGNRLSSALTGAESEIELTFLRNGQPRAFRAPVRQLDLLELWWLDALHVLFGCAFLWSAVLVHRGGSKRPAARAYVFTAINAFVLLTTFFDYHSTRNFPALFAMSTVGSCVSPFWLLVTFPEAPKLQVRTWRLLRALLAVGFAAMAGIGLLTLLRVDVRPLRLAVNLLVPSSLLCLAAGLSWRFLRGGPQRRRELAPTLAGFFLMPVVLVGLILAEHSAMHVVLPLIGLLVPASIGFAVARADVLRTRSVVRRIAFAVPTGLLGVAAGGSLGVWSRSSGAPPAVSVTLAMLAGVITSIIAWSLIIRAVFPALARYRPTIDDLAARLTEQRNGTVIRQQLLELVHDLLRGAEAELLAPPAPPATPLASHPNLGWTDDHRLVLPLRSGGETVAVLSVSRKPGEPLFTKDDLDLLELVCALAAITLHNAQVLEQLEERRRVEVTVSKDAQRLSVDTLAAELAHELAYPLNYFRHFVKQLKSGREVGDAQIEIGSEEVARLERMLQSMRKLQSSPLTLSSVRVASVVSKCAALLAPDLEAKHLSVSLSVPPELEVVAEPDAMLQVVANLLRNAIQAAPPGGRVGVRTEQREGKLELLVFDDGPGFDTLDARQLFTPWFTTRPGGMGLGLAITHRLIRQFGWSIDAERRGDETCFVVSITATAARTTS